MGSSPQDAPFDVLLYKIREGEDKERISAIKYLRQSLDRHHDDVLTSSVVSDLVDCMKPEEPIDLQVLLTFNYVRGCNQSLV